MNPDVKTFLMLLVRRGVTALGVFLISKAALDPSMQGQFVEIGTGLVLAGAEFGLEWWRKTGMVLISSQLARAKGIPLPHEEPHPPVVVPAAINDNSPVVTVPVQSKAA